MELTSNYVSVWAMSGTGKEPIKGLCYQGIWCLHCFFNPMHLVTHEDIWNSDHWIQNLTALCICSMYEDGCPELQDRANSRDTVTEAM